MTILDGKPLVAEELFGWSRFSVSLGMKDFRSRVVCVNDLSGQHKPLSELNKILGRDRIIMEWVSPPQRDRRIESCRNLCLEGN